MVKERVPLAKVLISPEARDGWEAFCLQYGVSRSAVIEALGLVMIEFVAGRVQPTRATWAVIERAKAVDQSRRRRL